MLGKTLATGFGHACTGHSHSVKVNVVSRAGHRRQCYEQEHVRMHTALDATKQSECSKGTDLQFCEKDIGRGEQLNEP